MPDYPGVSRVLLFYILVLCFSASRNAQASSVSTFKCRDELPPPDQPFRIVWNNPDHCENHHIPMNFSDYGIIFNTHRTFLGNEIQTLYHTGKWPRISGGQFLDGGLPQLFNETYDQTRADLGRNRIKNFQGLAALDFETWRPNFNTNYGRMWVYRDESIKLVKSRHPEYNHTMALQVAVAEWEAAAKRMFLAKLSIGQKLMPGGHWGYYNYPRTWGGNSSPWQNNKQSWLWRKATGLYPSIYLTNPNQTAANKIYVVQRIVTEAVRIQKIFSPPNTPIYPYSNIQKDEYSFFNKDHLQITLGLPADLGASGIVLWGSSASYRVPGQCNRLQQYVKNVLGPFARNLTHFMSNCSADVCGGHGRKPDDKCQREAAIWHCRCIRCRRLFEKKNPLKFGVRPPMWQDVFTTLVTASSTKRHPTRCRLTAHPGTLSSPTITVAATILGVAPVAQRRYRHHANKRLAQPDLRRMNIQQRPPNTHTLVE